MSLSFLSLVTATTKERILAKALEIAELVGLPVSSWQPGDPTRSLYLLESEVLAELEIAVVSFIRSGFLDYAEGEWLKVVAKQVFNVDVPGATYATTDVVLTNGGGGLYDDIEPGALTFKNTLTGKTYHNVTGGDLASGPGTTLTLTVEADDPGSDGSAGAGEIDSLVTTLLGVTCTNPTAAVGVDEQDRATTIQQCRNKLGMLSPNGPREAYAFVALDPTLSGTTNVTRVRVYADSDTGDVTVYLAGPAGSVTEPDRALVETGILRWATPLCITPTVLSAAPVVVPVTYTIWVYKSVNKSTAEVAADVQDALEKMFATRPIGGDTIVAGSGYLYQSLVQSTIRGVYPQAFRAAVSAPGDTALTAGQVATLGTVTPTVVFVVDP